VDLDASVTVSVNASANPDVASHHKERVVHQEDITYVHTHITEEGLTSTEKLAVCVQTVKRKSTEKGKKC